MSQCRRSAMAVLSMSRGRTKYDGGVINVGMLTKHDGGNINVAMFDIDVVMFDNINVAMFDIDVTMLRKRDGSDIDVTKISRGF